jgi:hypothetical protein
MRFMMLMIPKGYGRHAGRQGRCRDDEIQRILKEGLKRCRRMPSGLGSRDRGGTVVRVGPTADLILADCDGDS